MVLNPMLIRGVIHDEHNHVISMARLVFTAGPGSLPDIAALSGVDGTFLISVQQPGEYELECTADGFNPLKIRLELSSAHTTQVTLQLNRFT